jgi:hypothetical protein
MPRLLCCLGEMCPLPRPLPPPRVGGRNATHNHPSFTLQTPCLIHVRAMGRTPPGNLVGAFGGCHHPSCVGYAHLVPALYRGGKYLCFGAQGCTAAASPCALAAQICTSWSGMALGPPSAFPAVQYLLVAPKRSIRDGAPIRKLFSLTLAVLWQWIL